MMAESTPEMRDDMLDDISKAVPITFDSKSMSVLGGSGGLAAGDVVLAWCR